ncbi:uncharacterized protein LOC114523171 [Dendronephthya gigantea]|uniref:uncharacterized protein LOC114523171 n=1 Tax=Dendronephthya gigantea TaxID=151771 RepID=UPI00106D7827|nr:uncharacterized protein LOC114523171 [Dendronephthya gigantea]
MLKKIVRWRFVFIVLLIGSILWFTNFTRKNSPEIQTKQKVTINAADTVAKKPEALKWRMKSFPKPHFSSQLNVIEVETDTLPQNSIQQRPVLETPKLEKTVRMFSSPQLSSQLNVLETPKSEKTVRTFSNSQLSSQPNVLETPKSEKTVRTFSNPQLSSQSKVIDVEKNILPNMVKKPAPLKPRFSSQLNVIEVEADTLQISIRRKPKVTLPLPENILQQVGKEEWISRSIFDKKVSCASPAAKKDKEKTSSKSNMTCQIPNLNPFHPSIMKFINRVQGSSCNRYRSCGKLVNGIFHITDPNVVSAKYRSILRRGDFNYVLGASTKISSTEKIKDEFIEVECRVRNGRFLRELWLQPVPHEHLLKSKGNKVPGLPLNILIVGIDSLSHAHTQRKLPKFYKYLKNELGAIIFNGHSIVGDGTTEQLTAMLTGLGELEQYESRRHHRNPRPVDGWTWIYRELKNNGYLTGYSSDAPKLGVWQYRLLGFNKPPTDFYTRPFFLRASTNIRGEKIDYCLGSMNIAQHQFRYIRDIFDTFPNKLKFLLSYNVLFSHDDINLVENIEPDLISLVRDLKTKGQLNNTLLIVMGDHGARFGQIRMEIQGKLEERLPLFSMVFPPWFSAKYPELYKNLRTNTDRLTSWYDVHATFRHMLNYPHMPSDIKHGQSLLEEIPASRDCAQANVAPHWCPCQRWSAVDASDSHVQNAAMAVVDYINSQNSEHASSKRFCEILDLEKVHYALMELPNEKVMNFHETSDLRPVFNARKRPKQRDFCRYQIQLKTSPNNGIYEATVRYHLGWFIVSKDVSRVNQYGQQPECIARQLPHLRKFCLCKLDVKSTASTAE